MLIDGSQEILPIKNEQKHVSQDIHVVLFLFVIGEGIASFLEGVVPTAILEVIFENARFQGGGVTSTVLERTVSHEASRDIHGLPRNKTYQSLKVESSSET